MKPIPKHLVRGFTLLEMMVSIAVLLLLLSILAASTEGVALAFHAASGKLSTYAAARAGFNTLNQTLSQATLNTYLDYYDAGGNLRTQATVGSFVPSTYGRVSNMQFLVNLNGGSASPTGSGQELYFECPAAYSTDTAYHSTQGLLNACGYYVQYGSDATFGPSLISSPRWRYRLMQALEPTENLQVYAVNSASSDQSATWTANIANTGAGSTPAQYALPMAENIIAMIIWPRLPVAQDATGVTLAPAYSYDSQETVAPVGTPPTQPLWADQLPPLVQVTMLVIDEASATRIDTHSATPPTVISSALYGRFQDVTKYTTDLAAIESSLAAAHIGFEALNSSVVMRESKWTQ